MNPGQTNTSAGKSDQGQNNNNSQGQENDQSQIPQPAPANWQQLFNDFAGNSVETGRGASSLETATSACSG